MDLWRFESLLNACWRTLDRVIRKVADRELRKGPRGGGRDLQKILKHLVGADAAYLGRIDCKFDVTGETVNPSELEKRRRIILEALRAQADLDEPGVGPRGGVRWMPRYFVRRVAWHTLDHAWEIEDRLE
jgi:hypothetical protein